MTPVVRMTWTEEADRSLRLPTYESAGAAGADLRVNFAPGDRGGKVLAPLERQLFPTGLHVEIPEGFEMQIRPRSGLALNEGLGIPNAPGTIDSDYRGPLGIILINLSHEAIRISHGQRIAQAVIAPVVQARFVEVGLLTETERGQGGFGSTGNG